MMNILYTETLKRWGGQQNRVLQEAAGLAARGHKIVIACRQSSILAQRAKEAGIKTYELNMTKSGYPLTIPRIIRTILKEKIDIVCTNSSVDSWAGGLSALFTGRKLIRTKHNIYRVKKDPPTRFIYSLPDRFIAVSDASSEELIKTGYITPEKVVKIFGAIDPAKFSPENIGPDDRRDIRSSLGIPENAFVIGNTSGFTKVKGQEHLMTAANKLFAEVDNLYLLLLGGEGRKENALNIISPKFRDRVILPGLIRDVPRFLSIMDIFVMPSTVEAFGLSLIEAMAMLKPVAVTDIPSFREYITEGENGLFFQSADSDSIVNVLLPLIENFQKRLSLANNARKTVLDRFILDNMLDKTEEVYINALKEI
ncbi:MAG: glycosyltransferase family 4 protein [Nitrospirota bacterium]